MRRVGALKGFAFLRYCGCSKEPQREIKALHTRLERLERAQSVQRDLRFFATRHRSDLSLDMIIKQSLNKSFIPEIFCHREMPTILACLVQMVDRWPVGLDAMDSTAKLRQDLVEHFVVLADSKLKVPMTPESKKVFLEAVKKIDADMAERPATTLLEGALRELRQIRLSHQIAISKVNGTPPPKFFLSDAEENLLQPALDEFFVSWNQFVFLSIQLAHLTSPCDAGSLSCIGVLESVDLRQLVASATSIASDACAEEYGDAPCIRLEAPVSPSVPHMYEKIKYILIELLKNAMRATMERYAVKEPITGIWQLPDEAPPVTIQLVSPDPESPYVPLIIRDRGCGIPRAILPRVMHYGVTTAGTPTNLAGFGFGLPISRVTSRLFGGNLHLVSIEGYGTDVILYLRRLRDNSQL